MHPTLRLALPILASLLAAAHAAEPSAPPPYTLTEVWSPVPPVVTAPADGAPSDAIVLFDGKNLDAWAPARPDGHPWKIEDGAMVIVPTLAPARPCDQQTKRAFGDVQLHLEFRTPAEVKGSGQGRGNSGVFFMDKYEVQVLDCYGNKTYADGATGGLYGQHPALANACRPPGEWQTYDIIFNVPHFGPNGEVVSPAYATVILNGVVVQNHQAYRGPTGWKNPGKYSPHGPTGPLGLQYHNDSVSFRNIWVRPVPVVNEP